MIAMEIPKIRKIKTLSLSHLFSIAMAITPIRAFAQ
jgi:hypothetical protein